MGLSHKTPRPIRRGDFIRGLASVVIGASLADGEARAQPTAHHHPHETRFELVADRLSGSPAMQLPDAAQAELDDFVTDTVDALRAFLGTLRNEQRQQMLFPLEAAERTTSRDGDPFTESFCAVLTWCVPGWGLTIGQLDFRQRSAFEAFLRTALGVSGYEMVVAIRNRQHMIGALEANATNRLITEGATKLGFDKRYADLHALLEAMKQAGIPVPPEWLGAITTGGLNNPDEKIPWAWDAPGPDKRYTQFKSYAIAVFGNPGEGTWAVRIEGHHLSVNLTFLRRGETWEVHGTPIFVGAFPIIVPPPIVPPPDPPRPEDLVDPLLWQQGQSLGLALTRNVKHFWSALTEPQRAAAFRRPEMFAQGPPLLSETPPVAMLTALDKRPAVKNIEAGPHVTINSGSLSSDARRHLLGVYDELLSVVHPTVALAYRIRLRRFLENGTIVATWAGGDLAASGSQHFSSIAVGPFIEPAEGPLLVELMQTPQYSVTNTQLPWSNHLHVMLRDLQSPVWADPLAYHEQHDHA